METVGRQRPNDHKDTCLLGAHFSIAGGLHKALYTAADYQCTAVQIFTKNASTWKERALTDDDIHAFDQARKKTGIRHIASHTSYLINLASPEKNKHDRSCEALKAELLRCAALRISMVVLHPGSHMDAGNRAGIERIAGAVNDIFAETPDNPTRLLLETTAGQGSGIGHAFDQLAEIMDKIECPDRIGVCLDTSHVFAAGYDLRTETAYRKTVDAFDAAIGLENLFWIHVNDSKREFGDRVDRHEHIGRGYIGETAFRLLMNDQHLQKIPKVLETPKGNIGKGEKDWDRINLDMLRGFLGVRTAE